MEGAAASPAAAPPSPALAGAEQPPPPTSFWADLEQDVPPGLKGKPEALRAELAAYDLAEPTALAKFKDDETLTAAIHSLFPDTPLAQLGCKQLCNLIKVRRPHAANLAQSFSLNSVIGRAFLYGNRRICPPSPTRAWLAQTRAL